MPELRTRSAGAKVTREEYAEIEKLATRRGTNEVRLAEPSASGYGEGCDSNSIVSSEWAERAGLRLL